MNDVVEKIIVEVLKRSPTPEDYRRTNEMLRALPPEMSSSPGAMCDIVLRMDHLRQMEEAIGKASLEAQQRIHHDLPNRIDDAALKALSKIRDCMPIDAAHSARSLYKTAFLFTMVIATVTGAGGWILGVAFTERALTTTHAGSDLELGRCVDAATGAFTTSHRRGVRSTPISNNTVRNDLMICGAEYADRRAKKG